MSQKKNWLASSVYLCPDKGFSIFTYTQDGRTNLRVTNKKGKKKGERQKITNNNNTALKKVKRRRNAHANEDICLAAPTVLVNFFIHACCSLLHSAYNFSSHAFCFHYLDHFTICCSDPLLHGSTPGMLCFSLLCLSTSTAPSLHLPTINFSVLHWSKMSISVPISYHSFCLAFIWL